MAMIRRKRCRRPRSGWLGSGRLWTSAVTGIVVAVFSANAKAPAPAPSPLPQVERSAAAAPSPMPAVGRFESHPVSAWFDADGRQPVRLEGFARPRWPDGTFDR